MTDNKLAALPPERDLSPEAQRAVDECIRRDPEHFIPLWNGDMSDCRDWGIAALRLLGMLAAGTKGRNQAVIEEAFRASQMMGPEWDTPFQDGTLGPYFLEQAAQYGEYYFPPGSEHKPPAHIFKTLDEFAEEDARWLIAHWIPEGQITTVAADGGTGKTSLWCNLVAGLSSGRPTFLDRGDIQRDPMRVAFLSTEDSVSKKLKAKLRLAGANQRNIIAPDFAADKTGYFQQFKFGHPAMAEFIRQYHPRLCVFDPIQGFVPPEVNMGARNQMRDCMAPLVTLGEEIGTTFLVVAHSNKRKNAFGRDRISDSSDLWDISRSVIMAGSTEQQGIRYLSNEKNNYAALEETLLFSIGEDGLLRHEGTTWKRDRDFVQELGRIRSEEQSAPKKKDCGEYILSVLDEHEWKLPTATLEKQVRDAGFSEHTMRRAKKELKAEGYIRYTKDGKGSNAVWYIEKGSGPEATTLPEDLPTPFDD